MDERHSDGLRRADAIIVHLDIEMMLAHGLTRSGGIDENHIVGRIDRERGVLVDDRAYRIIEANGRRISIHDDWQAVKAAVEDGQEKKRGVALCVDCADIMKVTEKGLSSASRQKSHGSRHRLL